MYAVFRETTYPANPPVVERREYQEFLRVHADRKGYKGTVVADVGNGRLLTVTLWETAEDMNNAREALGPVIEQLLTPLMTSPSKLHGTGPVVVNDFLIES